MNFIKRYKTNIIVWLLVLISVSSFFIYKDGDKLDETIFDVDNIYDHIEELTSEKYLGKMAGTEGNELALKYVEDFFMENGIEPAGEDGTYYQTFPAIFPDIDTEPVFTINDSEGKPAIELTMYKDYTILPSSNVTEIDYTGEMILVGHNIFNIDPELIKDKIVVVESIMARIPDVLNVALENEVKGIFIAPDRLIANGIYGAERKYLDIETENYNGTFIGFLAQRTYPEIEQYVSESKIKIGDKDFNAAKNINLKVNFGFPIIQTSNILGKIDGKANNGKTLLITADIDGSGEGADGKYYPGAIGQTSGIASLMEVARVLAAQDALPYETIVFAGWNASLQNFSGSRYYINNPLYPLEKTTVIQLRALGTPLEQYINITVDHPNSILLRQSFFNYAEDSISTSAKFSVSVNATSTIDFKNENVACITLSNTLKPYDTTTDSIDNMEFSLVEDSVNLLLNYLKREIYRDNHIDYLGTTSKIILLTILFGLILNFLISTIYKKTPYIKLGKTNAEKLYFSMPITLIRKFYKYIFPFIVAIFLLVLISNIDPTINVKEIGGSTQKNFSLYLLLKHTAVFIKNTLQLNFDSLNQQQNIWELMFIGLKATLKLVVSALLLSTVFGILRGIYEGYRARLASFRTFISLIIFSVPDVLIVLVGFFICIKLTVNYPDFREMINLKEFIMPLLALSIVPAIYISRITFITVQDELKKDYIRNARAKGYSKFKIFTYELFPAIAFKIIDTMPTIMTMLLSNMIIVVYMFQYNGMVLQLLTFYKNGNSDGFAIIAGMLGIIYVLFTWGIRAIARIVNPLKREVKA